jgi:adenine-specific DNA methylase
MSIERDFDIPFVSALALREKQSQQNYRPVIAVHKWFARRPKTLFRGLALSEFGQESLHTAFYKANAFPGCVVADPFMGGGIPLLEANRVGCDVIGFDINPMAVWVVREEIAHLDLGEYEAAARSLVQCLESDVAGYYQTRCILCGASKASVKYFLWVKTQSCKDCGRSFDLFPGYLVAGAGRHPKNVLVCSACGELNEVSDLNNPGACHACGSTLLDEGPARHSRCSCPWCGSENAYPNPGAGPPQHRMFAIEYHCPKCKPRHTGRFFKKPDSEDLAKYAAGEARWRKSKARFVPAEVILAGDETDRLHR